MQTYVFAGLRNPGREYQDTRHNVGAMVLNNFAQNLYPHIHIWDLFSHHRKSGVEYFHIQKNDVEVYCVQPRSYMNECGISISAFLRYYGVAPQNLCVIHDELDLPLGKIRLKKGGSEAGHNGLRSISQECRTREYLRLRIGISRPTGIPIAAYVLEKFSPSERQVITQLFPLALQALESLALDGFVKSQNMINSL